jgi:hypothetical protein
VLKPLKLFQGCVPILGAVAIGFDGSCGDRKTVFQGNHAKINLQVGPWRIGEMKFKTLIVMIVSGQLPLLLRLGPIFRQSYRSSFIAAALSEGLYPLLRDRPAGLDRMHQFRTEVVRAGFADCFRQQDYGGIIQVAERLPEDVLREDPDLLMYFDSATQRKK